MSESGPSVREMFVNLTDALAASYDTLKQKGVLFADEGTFQKRIDVCMGCPHLMSTVGVNRCSICGCGLLLKVRLATSSCPINKWVRMTPTEIDQMKSGSIGHG
jgi:hypothetical protein